MRKFVCGLWLLLAAAPAWAGGSISVGARGFIIPPSGTTCSFEVVTMTSGYKEVVRFANSGNPTCYIMLPGMADTAASLTHLVYPSTSATSGTTVCWLMRQVAFPYDQYNTWTASAGPQYSRSTSMETVVTHQPAPTAANSFSVSTYNAALGSLCSTDSECDAATILIEITRNTSSCGGGNVPAEVDVDAWSISW